MHLFQFFAAVDTGTKMLENGVKMSVPAERLCVMWKVFFLLFSRRKKQHCNKYTHIDTLSSQSSKKQQDGW